MKKVERNPYQRKQWRFGACTAAVALETILTCVAAGPTPSIVVPSSGSALTCSVPTPSSTALAPASSWQLVEMGATGKPIPVWLAPASDQNGSVAAGRVAVTFAVPPRAAASAFREFRIEPAAPAATAPTRFRFEDVTEKSVGLWEGERAVWVYNHGIMTNTAAPARYNRSTYIHPLYGLDGEILSDDFPRDHFHHRGLFWAWPHVAVHGKPYDLWMIQGIHQRFERWLARAAGPNGAVLGVENGWFIGDKRVVQERVWIRTYAATDSGRAIDFDLVWVPQDAVTLQGAEGKSYGGLTLRYAPGTGTVITTPLGQETNDLHITRLPWADLSARFGGASKPSGAAILIGPDHPDYPPEWLTRHYGVLCVGWPGVQAKTFQPGQVIRCRYRVWIHRGQPDVKALEKVYRAYEDSLRTVWKQP